MFTTANFVAKLYNKIWYIETTESRICTGRVVSFIILIQRTKMTKSGIKQPKYEGRNGTYNFMVIFNEI